MSQSPPRSRARRLVTGLSVSVATLVVLGFVLEIATRCFVPHEFFSVYQPIYQADPHAGYVLRANFEGYAFGAPLRTNGRGFRGSDWSAAPPADVTRVAVVGDSHAFGYGVGFDESFGQQLGRERSGAGAATEVLTFAVPGYNTVQELAVLRHHALSFAPDLVVILVCENDHEPARGVDADGWMVTAPQQGSRRVEYRPFMVERSLLRHSRFAMLVKFLWRRATAAERIRAVAEPTADWLAPVGPAPVSGRLAESVAKPLHQMLDVCSDRGVAVVVALLAAADDYRRLALDVRARGVPVVELLALYDDISSWSQLQAAHGLGWDTHLDAASHSRWARAVAAVIAERGLLDGR